MPPPSKIPVIIALGDFASGVTSWAFRLRDALADHPRYTIRLLNCTDTGNHIGRFDLHATSRERAGALLAANGEAIVIPNFVWDLYAVCAERIAAGQPLRIAGFCRADSEAEYYKPLRWYAPIIGQFAGVSPVCAATLREQLNLEAARVHTLPTGVDVPEVLDRTYQTEPIRLAYGGRLVQEQKRVMDFVLLVEKLYGAGVDFRFTLAGSGRDRDALRAALRAADPEKRVRFVTRKKPEAMPAFWANHDVFVQASAFEGTSNSMLESMAQGTVPVVTRTASGVEGIVADGENGYLVPVGDMGAMAGAIGQLARDRPHLASMGRRAHDAARPYAMTNYVEKFVAMLDAAMDRAPQPWPEGRDIAPPKPFHGIPLSGGRAARKGRLAILFPSPIRGGAEDYALTVAAGAVRAGYDVQGCFSGRRALRGLAKDFFEAGAFHNTLEICDVGSKRDQAPIYKRFTRTIRILRRLRPRAVLYELCGMQYGLVSLFACACLRVPTLVVFQLVRDDRRFSPLRRALYRWMRTRRQRYVAVSHANRQLLARAFSMPEEEIQVIPNGVHLATFQTATEERDAIRRRIRTELGLADDSILCLTVGRLSPQKGHDVLIPAIPHIVARHPEAHFLWAGDGPMARALKAQLKTYQAARHVTMLGQRDDIPDLLRAADLFVHPARFEGQPFSLLEAMAAGLPIVTTDASGIAELIDDGVHGLLCPADDIAALRERILSALDAPAVLARCSEAAQARVTEFSEEAMVRQTLDALEALGGRP